MPRDKLRPPRFTTELNEDLYTRTKAIPWGMRRAVMEVLIGEMVELYEQHGNVALAALVARDFSIIELMKAKEEKKGGNS